MNRTKHSQTAQRCLWLALLLLLLGSTGCVGPIQATINRFEADAAIRASKKSRAWSNSCFEYYIAQLYAKKGLQEQGYAEFEVARDYGRLAANYAKQARRQHLKRTRLNQPPPVTCLRDKLMRRKYKQKDKPKRLQ
jgi:hypothetical protein